MVTASAADSRLRLHQPVKDHAERLRVAVGARMRATRMRATRMRATRMRATLPAGIPGVTVNLESLDPAIALISRTGASEGTASIDVDMLDGRDRIGYVLHGGLEDVGQGLLGREAGPADGPGQPVLGHDVVQEGVAVLAQDRAVFWKCAATKPPSCWNTDRSSGGWSMRKWPKCPRSFMARVSPQTIKGKA